VRIDPEAVAGSRFIPPCRPQNLTSPVDPLVGRVVEIGGGIEGIEQWLPRRRRPDGRQHPVMTRYRADFSIAAAKKEREVGSVARAFGGRCGEISAALSVFVMTARPVHAGPTSADNHRGRRRCDGGTGGSKSLGAPPPRGRPTPLRCCRERRHMRPEAGPAGAGNQSWSAHAQLEIGDDRAPKLHTHHRARPRPRVARRRGHQRALR
jgi:hypothetical protein